MMLIIQQFANKNDYVTSDWIMPKNNNATPMNVNLKCLAL